MGLTREDLTDPKNSAQDKIEIKAWLTRAQSNDSWAQKMFKKIGVLITSHPGNRPYLKASIDSHVKLGLWICVAYDSFIDPDQKTLDYNRWMPAFDTMKDIDTFIIPHHQVWGGVLYPYFWLMKFGAAAMRNFEYVYCTNGDFIIETPQNFNILFEIMEDADVMTCGHDEPGRYANTAGFIIKTEALIAVMQHWQNHFIPFDVYEKYTQDIGNAEGRFGRAIHDLGLKQKQVDPPGDDMLRVPGKGTWYKLLGFRHIHSEHNYAYRNRLLPPHYRYLDERFMGDEYRIIKEFWDNGGEDTSILEKWWAKD